jgi:hypothetical protein
LQANNAWFHLHRQAPMHSDLESTDVSYFL